MVTGDSLNTARTIAKDCGILPNKESKYSCMWASDFREMVGGLIEKEGKPPRVKNLKKFKQLRNELVVLAQSTPLDKYIFVCGLKQCGDVVAVTGDGANDGPALRMADVGFAMGVTGTDIAKQASDIVLLDDNFASAVEACKWGRNIYDNI